MEENDEQFLANPINMNEHENILDILFSNIGFIPFISMFPVSPIIIIMLNIIFI